jgi:hypothetical protein
VGTATIRRFAGGWEPPTAGRKEWRRKARLLGMTDWGKAALKQRGLARK